LRQAAERTAINAPMQGTAADIIKRAMIAVDDWLHTASIDARMIMQVHDELVFEIAEQRSRNRARKNRHPNDRSRRLARTAVG
jgi:DNA polymerase-1